MNNQKAKRIKQLINEQNPNLLLTIAKIYGKEKTKNMNKKQLYRAAKKIYKEKG